MRSRREPWSLDKLKRAFHEEPNRTDPRRARPAQGINRSRALPDPTLGAQWDSIVMDYRLKKQLLSQAVLNFSLRAKVDRSVIPCNTARR
jgi:hypothetical protein